MNAFELRVMQDIRQFGRSQRGGGTDAVLALALTTGWVTMRDGRMAATAAGDREIKWAGMDCYCGGGWRIGHAAGCPESPVTKLVLPAEDTMVAHGEPLRRFDQYFEKRP